MTPQRRGVLWQLFCLTGTAVLLGLLLAAKGSVWQGLVMAAVFAALQAICVIRLRQH